MRPSGGRALPLLLLVVAAACNQGNPVIALHALAPSTTPVNVPSLTDDFYLMPFPNDLRIGSDGTVDFATYPRPAEGGLIKQYIDTFDESLRGFGTNSGIYFRFDGEIDPGSLPKDANASIDAQATAFVVDVTPGSPTFGKRSPVLTRFTGQSYDFIGPYWMALLPFPGVPLREKTTYAAVLTSGLRGAGGGAVRRSADFDGALRNRSVPAYAPLYAWLDTQPGLAGRVVNATVFTTVDATSIMGKLRTAVYDQAPPPVLADLKAGDGGQPGVFHVYEGTYQGPNFQEGEPPYQPFGSGKLHVDAAGNPQLVRMETLRVALSVPDAPMPAEGWPVVLYAHGTGGSYRSFLSSRDGSGAAAAKVTTPDGTVISRLAMISIDQVLHGPRDPSGSDTNLTFFNFPNLVGAHDNPKQGALDDFQLLRLVKAIDIAQAPTTGAPIKFDPSRIYFKGHSQGGLTGPLFLAAEPDVKAAVLSGAGGVLILSLLHKTEPVNVPNIVGALLRDPVDEFHPLLSLAQAYFEDSDPINYARLFFKEPPAGFAPKHIYHSLGLVDRFTPVPVIKALALGMGVQPVQPTLDAIDGLELAGLSWAQPPLHGNVAGGQATGVLLEYTEKARSDGHFVVFEIPSAVSQSNRFLATHAATGMARLEAP